MQFRTFDQLNAGSKRVLLRADLNVPVKDGLVTDRARLERLCPTIRELSGKGARVVICSHFGRPKGKQVPEVSLRPIAKALEDVLGRPVHFMESCVGPGAEQAVNSLEKAYPPRSKGVERQHEGKVRLSSMVREHSTSGRSSGRWEECVAW